MVKPCGFIVCWRDIDAKHPPFMVAAPLQSKPSPSASIKMFPSLMVISEPSSANMLPPCFPKPPSEEEVVPDVALIPSSEE